MYFLFSAVDIKDLMSYEFIRLNKDNILEYKNENSDIVEEFGDVNNLDEATNP